MADAVIAGMNLGGVASGTLNVVIMILSIVLLTGVILGAFWLWDKKQKYSQYNCVILERDGFGQLRQTYDKAGVFVDKKTNNKRFFMKKNNVGLTPDNIPYIPTAKGKTVYLIKHGLKNFAYINFNITKDNTGITLETGEEDVNWAINAYERQKKLFQQSMLMQLMPFIIIAFVTIIIMVIFIYFFKDFATLKDMAQALQQAAIEIGKYKAARVV